MDSSRLTRRAAILTGTVAGALAAQASPGQSRAQLLRRPYQPSEGGPEREYFVYLPAGFHTEPGRLWPVMLFLHGSGERGDGRDDLEYTMIHGPLMEAWVQGRDLPFVIIQPQLDAGDGNGRERNTQPPRRGADGSIPDRNRGKRADFAMRREEPGEEPRWGKGAGPRGWEPMEADLLAMVDATLEDFRGDPQRIHLTGLSLGGFGSFFLASNHPQRWASVAPVCGAGGSAPVAEIAKAELPLWILTGGRDSTVKPEWVIQTAREIEGAGHPEVRMTVHEDLGHNVWTRVYEGWDLYHWMLAQRRNAKM